MEEPVTLKLPEVLAGQLRIDVWVYLDIGIRFIQNEPHWDAERKQWVIDIILRPIDHHLKLRDGA